MGFTAPGGVTPSGRRREYQNSAVQLYPTLRNCGIQLPQYLSLLVLLIPEIVPEAPVTSLTKTINGGLNGV
jgi:hypothetical protein